MKAPEAGEEASVPRERVLKGRNVSGRAWKRRDQKRATAVVTDAQPRKPTWEERQAKKRRRDEVKELERQMQEEKRAKKVEERQRREERLAQRQANILKGTVMQTISKTHKLKTMNKKQLRQIKKTQVNSRTGQVELVSPWAK